MSPRARAAIATVGLAVLTSAGCSGSSAKPKPTTTLPPPSSSTSFTVVTVPGNPRSTTTIPAEIGPGEATLAGTVAGPDGPAAEATVRVERLVGDDVVSVDVKAANGSWQLPSISGGRYRARAWHSPDLAQLEPEIFFLGATETKQVNLVMTRFTDLSVVASTAPAPLRLGQPGALVTQVVSGSVDGQGVVRATPRPGVPVQLVTASGVALESADRQVTDAEGNNSWRVRCLAAGPPSVVLVIANVRYVVNVASCAPD